MMSVRKVESMVAQWWTRLLRRAVVVWLIALSITPVGSAQAGWQPEAPSTVVKAATAILTTYVDGGFMHGCSIRSNGQISCWGDAEQGRLAAPTTGTYTELTAALNHSCALRSDRVAVCWGTNVYGALNVPAGILFTQLSAGLRHVCGVTTTSSIVCWGFNDPGIDQAIPPAGNDFVAAAAGHMHNCAIRTNSNVICWGRNANGEGTPSTPSGYRQLSLGENHSCGLRTDDTIACWGLDGDGQLLVPAGTFRQVSAGNAHNCAIRTDNTLVCWGLNNYGQAFAPAGTFSQVGAGAEFTCAVRTDGAVLCWGRNDSGQAPTVTMSGSLSGSGNVNIPYSRTLTASGGTTPYTFCVLSGSLPPGLTLATNGQLTGTPTGAGSFNGVVMVTDKNGIGTSQPFAISIATLIIPLTLPGGTIGATYNQGLTAVGAVAPVTFSLIAGSLPPGLTLSTAGLITGIPSGVGGSYPLTVRAVDANNSTAERAYTLVISEAGATTWYFAEGYTGGFFDEYLTIQNPNAATADILITYYLDGAAPVEKAVMVPANNRYTVEVHGATEGVGRGKAVSAKVESRNNIGIVVERPMYFTYNGEIPGMNGITGGHNVMGSTVLRPVWLFGEGYTGTNFEEYLTIMNPHPVVAPITITYFLDGEPPQAKSINVPAASRYTVRVHQTVEGVGRGKAVAARVETSLAAGIVVERPMYFKYGVGARVTGGHNVMGTAEPKPSWYFADGSTEGGFDTFLTIMNTFPTAAQLRLTYYVVGETTSRIKQIEAPGQRRTTVEVHDPNRNGIERGKLLSIKVETLNGINVVVERPMYFTYSGSMGTVNGGYNVMGATAPARSWLFAEGYTGTGFDEYMVVLNPTGAPVSATVTYYLTGAPPKSVAITIDPFSRRTVVAFDPTEGVGRGKAVSAKVESTSDSIVVERPMYFRYGPGGAIDGGHTVMGYAPGQ